MKLLLVTGRRAFVESEHWSRLAGLLRSHGFAWELFSVGGGSVLDAAMAHYKALWALPGGFIEPRERLFDGALRELREETGLDMLPAYLKRYCRDKEVFDHPERSPRGRAAF